jgi:predicted ribosomally synthesized peptide with SipW-like signal peptide
MEKRKRKKILIILSICAAVVLLLAFGATGSFAWFSDQEKSEGNIITAGSLNLLVDGKEGVDVISIEVANVAPGWSNIYKWALTNEGTLPGVVKIAIDNVQDYDNFQNTPELIAEQFIFDPAGAPPQTVGIDGKGELSYLLRAVPSQKHIFPSVEKSPSVPIPNSWMSKGGGLGYLGSIGFFELGRNTAEATLAPGATMEFWLRLSLDENLKVWDGTKWHDIDDNVIQNDSVTFDILFRLEQAQ